jgi:hypothetical protein
MTTQTELILQAMVTRLATDSGFPPADLDVPEPTSWSPMSGANASLSQALAVQGGPVTVTRDGGRDEDYELELEAMIAYAVEGTSASLRRSARDSAIERIVALIAANRTLGLGVQVYAEIGAAERDDRSLAPGAPPVALALITVLVTFIAPSPAG